MGTIDLLSQMINSPLSIKCFSAGAISSFWQGGKSKLSSLVSIEMLKVFIDIVKREDNKRDKADKCIKVSIPEEITSADYKTLLDFVKKHCDKANATSLAQLILSSSKEFILMHPSSDWDELMMLRLLRETLTFKNSADYESKIAAQEKALMTRLLQKHYLLELVPGEKDNRYITHLLNSVTPESLSLDTKKAALLTLIIHHISSDSLEGGRFNKGAHDRKNFRMLLIVSEINSTDTYPYLGLLSDQAPLANQPAGIFPPETVHVFSEDGLTVSTPKNIGMHWENFFAQCKNAENSASPIELMTLILKKICEKNHFEHDSLSALLNWFNVLKEYTKIRTKQYAEISIAESKDIVAAKRIYNDLYKFLLENEKLPSNATPPVVTDAVTESNASNADDDNTKAVFDFDLVVSSNVTMRKRSPANTPFSSRKKPKPALDVIYEGGSSNENTPEKIGFQSPEYVINTNRFASPQQIVTHHGEASLSSLQYLASPPAKTPIIPQIDEPAKDNEENHFEKDSMLDKHSHLSSSDHQQEDDESNDDSVYPELPSESDFAITFINYIKDYYSTEKTQLDKLHVVNDLIELVLDFAKEMVRQTYGDGVRFEAASQAMTVLENSKNQAVTLEEIFIHFYHILYATVFSISDEPAAWQDGFNSYYFHASATLTQLNELILSGDIEPHVTFLATRDRSGDLPIQKIMYRLSKKAGQEVTGEALKKQPYHWGASYKNLDDRNFLNDRYQKEAWCVLLIIESLRKKPEEFSIEEPGLVVEAIHAALKENCQTPEYNPMFFLAASYNGSREEELPIISLDDEAIQHRMVQLCKHLFEHIQLTYKDDDYIESLTDQQKVIYYNTEKFLTLYQLRSGQVAAENFDYETMSVSSQLTGVSKQSRLSRGSAYTFRSSSSQSSIHSRGNAFADNVLSAGASTFWGQLLQSEKPLDKKEVKFILKGYTATVDDEKLKYGLAETVLHKAFDWLHALPSGKAYASSGWMSAFSRSALLDVASEDWRGLMPYLAMKKQEATFVAYYAYHVKCKKEQTDYILKTFEIELMIDHIKILYSQCYMDPLWHDTMELIGKTLDAKLSAKNVAKNDIERLQKMLTKDDGEQIIFALPGQELSVLERVEKLAETAKPEASSSSSYRGLLGKRK